ncbi:MAG: hypothetical protein ACLTOV_10945 [Phocaeicola sp.]
MRNRTYGGVRGRKTKVGRKLLRFPPTRFSFIGRIAETLTNLAQIAEGCRLLSLQPSKAPFAAVPTLRFFVSENSSGVRMNCQG